MLIHLSGHTDESVLIESHRKDLQTRLSQRHAIARLQKNSFLNEANLPQTFSPLLHAVANVLNFTSKIDCIAGQDYE